MTPIDSLFVGRGEKKIVALLDMTPFVFWRGRSAIWTGGGWNQTANPGINDFCKLYSIKLLPDTPGAPGRRDMPPNTSSTSSSTVTPPPPQRRLRN
ncbi:hypothetical protein NQZ68_007069 [Dissostichus eleginoides]|nr:hypothetical protein NQZ68_007069 [Dissostichus eleginoides]